MVSNQIDTSNKTLLFSQKLKKKCEGGDVVLRLFTKVRAVVHHKGVRTLGLKGSESSKKPLFWCTPHPQTLTEVLVGNLLNVKDYLKRNHSRSQTL